MKDWMMTKRKLDLKITCGYARNILMGALAMQPTGERNELLKLRRHLLIIICELLAKD